jgi:hypothetical protein
MINAAQIRKLADDYLSERISSRLFLEQFALLSHNIHKCDDADAVRLCNQIESQLAAFMSEIILEKEFQKNLATLTNEVVVSIFYPQPTASVPLHNALAFNEDRELIPI